MPPGQAAVTAWACRWGSRAYALSTQGGSRPTALGYAPVKPSDVGSVSGGVSIRVKRDIKER
jgi:hypothetical protein